MTLSIHKYADNFFPETGKLDDDGLGQGKHFCINVPLKDGIDDNTYVSLFKNVTQKVFDAFCPSVIVLQCGADSLGCDRLGAFNLSIAAHGECVNFVKKLNVPLLALGGGGYTIKNVSRCWTYETAVLVGASIPNELPRTVYDSFFADSQWKLHPPISGKVTNLNTSASIRQIIKNIDEKLRYLQGAPSVAMQEIPPELDVPADDWKTEELKEIGSTSTAGEQRNDDRLAHNEFFDSEKDVDAAEPAPKVAARGPSRSRPRNETDSGDTTTPPPRRSRRGGRRGRGRGRGRGNKTAVTADRDAIDSDARPESEAPVENVENRHHD